MIKRSSKLNQRGEFVHNNQVRQIRRTCMGLCLGGESPGCCVVLGEEFVYGNVREPHRFILAEGTSHDAGELCDIAIFLEYEFRCESIYSKLNQQQQDYLNIFNRREFNQNRPQLKTNEAPGHPASEKMFQHVSLVADHLQKKKKTLWFFDDSVLPSALSSLPSNTAELKAGESPSVAALGYCLSGMIEHPFERVSESELIPQSTNDW